MGDFQENHFLIEPLNNSKEKTILKNIFKLKC